MGNTILPVKIYTAKHVIYSGVGRIAGTVKDGQAGVSSRVVLFHRPTMRAIDETISYPVTGSYVFSGLNMDKHMVIAFDISLSKNAVIADNITPDASV